MLEIPLIGAIGAILVGISLGVLGGGGSTLAVPVLVYLIGISPTAATAYSLCTVGVASGIGALQSYRSGMVDIRNGMLFAIPSMAAVFAVQRWGLPAIPEAFSLGSLQATRDGLIMSLFAALMLGAGGTMIRSITIIQDTHRERWWLVVMDGFLVGALTGLVGAGGGFLIVPALVLILGIPMHRAVGTSLMIISLKSSVGFFGALGNGIAIDWLVLLPFAGLAILGIFIGKPIKSRVQGLLLKKAFGWFVLLMGCIILVKELI